MANEENKKIIVDLCRAVDLDHKDIIFKLYDPNVIFHSASGDLKGLEEFMAKFWSVLTAAYPHFYHKIEDIIAENDKVVIRYSFWPSHPEITDPAAQFQPQPQDKPLLSGLSLFHLTDGKVTEEWLVTYRATS